MRAILQLALATILVTTPTLFADQPPDPRELLEQADRALRAVQSVQYEAKGKSDGAFRNSFPPMHGSVTLAALPIAQQPNAPIPKLRVDAEFEISGAQNPIRATLANDGTTVRVLDHHRKTFAQAPANQGRAFTNNAAPLLIEEFAAPAPFRRELAAFLLEYAGSESVQDTACHVINCTYKKDGNSTRWYLAQDDLLPRRVVRSIKTPIGAATIETTITSFTLAPTIDEAKFAPQKPEDYQVANTRRATGPPASRGGGRFLEAGTAAPDFTLESSTGEKVNLKDLRGKVVLLDFWATWCGPCKMAMPGIQRLHEKFKDKPVAIFGVNCWERSRDPMSYIKSKGYTYPQLLKADAVASQYQVRGIPTFYLIGPDGKILMANAGASPVIEKQIEATIEETLKSLPGPPPASAG